MTYWVCAYANNQHDLSAIQDPNPANSSFVKAIELAEGRVISVIDEGGVTYSRIWCDLEIHLALRDGGTYEMYTAREGCEVCDYAGINEARDAAKAEAKRNGVELATADTLRHLPIVRRRAVGLTAGPCRVDKGYAYLQTFRQAAFPLELVRRAFTIRVQAGEASVESDRTHILNYMAGREGAALEHAVLGECAAYEATNAKLHGAFAAAAWRKLLEGGEAMAPVAERLAASGLRKLQLSLTDCAAATDEHVRLLAAHLPPTLEEVEFELEGSGVTAEGAWALLASVARCAKSRLRELDMIGCGIGGPIPEALGECRALEVLLLNRSPQLTGAIPEALGQCRALKKLYLRDTQVTGPLPEALRERQEAGELKVSLPLY